jgi:hypothetical protein
MVSLAASSGWDTLNLGLRAADEGTVNQWKRFRYSSPELVITYNRTPDTPVAGELKARTDATSADLACVTGDSRPFVRSTKPWLRAKVTDPDGSAGGKLSAAFTWQRWTGSTWTATGSKTSGKVSPNAWAAVQITSALTDTQRYRWQARTRDGHGLESGWSPWCEFDVLVVGPTTGPLVVSADGLYPEEPLSPTGGLGVSGRFTISANGIPNVADYVYKLEDGQERVAAPSAQGGSVTVWVTPDLPLENVLHVWSRDAAGNRSPLTSYHFLADVATGPVARWAMDEGAGTTLTATPAAHAAQLTSAGWASQRRLIGDPATLYSADRYAETGGPVLDTTKAFSVAAWARLTSTSTYATVVSQDGANVSMFRLEYRAEQDAWCFSMRRMDTSGGQFSHACATSPPQAGVWTHLVGVYDPGAEHQAMLLVNGVKAGEAVYTTPWAATGVLAIGRSWVSPVPSALFSGAIDDVRVWQRAVHPDLDIAPLLAPMKVGSWDFEDWHDTTAADDSGRGNHGTLSHDPWAVPTGTSWNPEGYNVTTSMALDGAAGHVSTAGPVLRTDNSFTVSAWVRLADRDDYRNAVAQDGAQLAAFRLYYHYTLDRFCFLMYHTDQGGATWTRPCSTQSPELNTWVHLAGVYNAQDRTVTLYVNGQPAQSFGYGGASPWQADGQFLVGRTIFTPTGGPTAQTNFWSGDVDQVRAYQGAMTATQVLDLYNE